jgi:hypothetical protein
MTKKLLQFIIKYIKLIAIVIISILLAQLLTMANIAIDVVLILKDYRIFKNK